MHQLQEAELIIHWKKGHTPVDRGVYFLIKRNRIVYVGITLTSLRDRLVKHLNKGVQFDSYNFESLYSFTDKDIRKTEARYIEKFRPRYNRMLPLVERYTE